MSNFINGWTKESTIDFIRKNFKEKAINKDSGQCQYLTEDGNKCAVGLFIPAGHSAQNWSGSFESLIRAYPGLEDIMPLEPHSMRAFQKSHDSPWEHLSLDESRETVLKRMTDFLETLD